MKQPDAFWRSLWEWSPVPTFIFLPNGQPVDMNRAANELIGRKGQKGVVGLGQICDAHGYQLLNRAFSRLIHENKPGKAMETSIPFKKKGDAFVNTVGSLLVLENQEAVIYQVHQFSDKLDSPETKLLSGLRILIAEDNAINLKIAQKILEGEGAILSIAKDGEAALHALEKQGEALDLVLMDIQMPKATGIEVTQKARREMRLLLPILALTAGTSDDEVQQVFEAGLDDFIGKPFQVNELLYKVTKWCGRDWDAQSQPDSKPSNWAFPNIPGIQIADAVQACGGDSTFFNELLLQFKSFAEWFVPELEDALTADRSRAAELCHKFKGSSGSIGARKLAEIAGRLETAIRKDTSSGSAFQALKAGTNDLLKNIDKVADPRQNYDDNQPPILNAEVKEWLGFLENHNIEGLYHFQEWRSAHRNRWSQAQFEFLDRAMNQLEFDVVLQAVQEWLQKA